MDAAAIFKDLRELVAPDGPHAMDVEAAIVHIMDTFLPDAAMILAKKPEFFMETDRVLFGASLSAFWEANPDKRDALWEKVQESSMAAVFQGGVLGGHSDKLFRLIKQVWSGKNDEVSRILEDDESEGRFSEMMAYVKNTRTAAVFSKIIQEFVESGADFGGIHSMEDVMDLVKDPENPFFQKMAKKLENAIKSRVQTGQITPHIIQEEIEGIKVRAIALFGDAVKDMLGLSARGTTTPASVLTGSSPEARRQRMVARLQKKQRDKNSA